jgi:ectoine hydroxylase-related dioxygenase (phytanoyl-CoA dioxygenase family)
MEYKLGDATVHHGYTAHGTLPNTTDRPRLSYIVSYTPADCRWWDGEVRNAGAERRTLDDERHPIVYSRTGD